MADYVIPPPEPKPIDEKNLLELQQFAERAVLRGHPSGSESCGNCLYYLDTDAEITYCWHPQLRILVGQDWWCQWWEQTLPDESPVAGS